LALLKSTLVALQFAELFLSGLEAFLGISDFTLNLFFDGNSHLVFSHLAEFVHLLVEGGQAVANLGPLDSELCLDFSSYLAFLATDLNQGLVAHDFLTLR
jgi:hypothetical protein